MKQYNINGANMPIDDNGNLVALKSFPHFNGANWFEFESEAERKQFIDANTPPNIWDKEYYCQQVNDAHNALFESMYKERNYLTIGEIPIWANDTEFGEESLSLQAWWIDTCKIVQEYTETVTEETALPVGDFISSLPSFAFTG